MSELKKDRRVEISGDPDEGFPMRELLRRRLIEQKQAVSNGERGEPFEDVVRRLGPNAIGHRREV